VEGRLKNFLSQQHCVLYPALQSLIPHENKMKKLIMIMVILMFTVLAFTPANAGNGPGAAPNSGDGIPDGSGYPSPPSPGPKGN
jgi:hypothetical protein